MAWQYSDGLKNSNPVTLLEVQRLPAARMLSALSCLPTSKVLRCVLRFECHLRGALGSS